MEESSYYDLEDNYENRVPKKMPKARDKCPPLKTKPAPGPGVSIDIPEREPSIVPFHIAMLGNTRKSS